MEAMEKDKEVQVEDTSSENGVPQEQTVFPNDRMNLQAFLAVVVRSTRELRLLYH